MPFCLLPLLDRMIDLYQQPRDIARFNAYLTTLTAKDGKDLDLPIGVYNPMAREHVLARLQLMKQLGAEDQLAVEIRAINQRSDAPNETVQVGIGLADDLGGGWTNRYSTDYQHKFKTRALLVRRFCTPVFWTSEPFSPAQAVSRSREYLHRFIYQQQHGMPVTLADHIRQEGTVLRQSGPLVPVPPESLSVARSLFEENRHTDDYPFIFTFLYGDAAAATFGYRPIGAFANMGLAAAAQL